MKNQRTETDRVLKEADEIIRKFEESNPYSKKPSQKEKPSESKPEPQT